MDMDTDMDMESSTSGIKQTILERAAIATADLAQPVRLVPGETGGWVLMTPKGENTPAHVTENSEYEMQQFFEDIAMFVDKNVAHAESEDSTPVCMLTAPEWFGPYRHMGAFYTLEDLSLQLDPNRSKTVIDPIYDVLVSPSPEYTLGSPKIRGLKAVLDKSCSRRLSCVYRQRYPHVESAGPVALSPVVLSLLTRGIQIAALNQDSLQGILAAVTDVLLPSNTDQSKSDASQCTSASINITADQCICCLLTQQTRSYIDASTEVAYQEDSNGLLSATTFIGVMKTKMAELGCRKNEVDFFAPSVNIHDRDRCYLADYIPFEEYKLQKRRVRDEDLWVVNRSPVNDSHFEATQGRIHSLTGFTTGSDMHDISTLS